MSPIILFLLAAAVLAGFWVFKNRTHVVSVSARFALEVLDASLVGYAAYVAMNVLANLNVFSSWKETIRLLFFIPPYSSWQYIAMFVGAYLAYLRYRQGPGMDYTDKRTPVSGRVVWPHRSALIVANSILALRTIEENKIRSEKGLPHLKRPQHMDPDAEYERPEDEEELRTPRKLEDVETNGALKPYLSEPDELRTVLWGGLRLPMEESTKHFLVVGGTGSGKTLIIHALMKSVLKQISRKGDFRAFIYDDKLDFLPFAHQLNIADKVWNLDPFDEKGVAWDIAADITSPEDARMVAEALVPGEKHSHNVYFEVAPAQIVAAAINRFRECCGKKWTFRDLIYVCSNHKRLLSFLKDSKDVVVRDTVKNIMFPPRDSSDDVMGTLSQKIAPYIAVSSLWSHAEKKVSVRRWHRSNAILLLVMRQSCSVALTAINQALFRIASTLLVDEPDSTERNTWVFLDEMREIGKIEGLTRLNNKGRAKGVRIVMGFQTIEGMHTAWGNESAGAEAAGICSNRIFLHSDSEKTCEWMARSVGSTDLAETIFTHSHSSGPGGCSVSVSWNTQLQARATMSSANFDQNLKTAPEYGLTALNIVPLIGTYVSWFPWSWVEQNLPRTEALKQDFRSPSKQRPKRWTKKDLKRLELPDTFWESDMKTEESDPSSGTKGSPEQEQEAAHQAHQQNLKLQNTKLRR